MKFFLLIFSFFVFITLGDTVDNTPPKIKIALLSAPSIIGRYTQSCTNVALATLLSANRPFELISYNIKDESPSSLSLAYEQMAKDTIDAVLAPLTVNGVKNLLTVHTDKPIFIPTVHKRDVGAAPENIIFGSIDYEAQLKALAPYMANSLAIFYDDSLVGSALSKTTQSAATESYKNIPAFSFYPIDVKGANIVKIMGKPGAFSKKTIVTHLPIVKTAMLISQMTFTGVHERNIVSTQINYDPTLIILTQYQDRKNMIIANSILEQVPSIYESNALINNDLTFDWINYTTSVGADYLMARLYGYERAYPLQMADAQVIYPIQLMRPKESGFEAFTGKP